ncbi:DUF983 domain-containing protein [Amycolatopsis alkalitolerans]|uniref:DUF983 domain-containing protein n=1 Tax=Amycolatopsis alkalitolerans TaxID=2547244 RepID=A0A5C4M6T2_9PSEU|nr:DUF983 domain-containing protein [Amycolatopsis alkalitolerans]TNC27365.1 DUF983 domain-containing protein [Amycolatopsis alkalitolerans]
MNRRVQGLDGREWTVRAQMEWRRPVTVEDFEHDVAGSPAPGVAMLSVTLVLAVILVAWLPEGVVVPAWVIWGLLLIALFFPLRWVLNRPWGVVAETDGDALGDHPPERWVGVVSGMFRVRGEVAKVVKAIRTEGLPDFDGPLHPME